MRTFAWLPKIFITILASWLFISSALAVDFGVYDFNRTFTRSPFMAYEQTFVNWADYPPGQITRILTFFARHNRWAQLTVEPFNAPRIGSYGTLLQDVIAGRYDQIIMDISDEILASNVGGVIITWGHEMDKASNASRYPWVNPNPQLFIQAFQHVVTQFRADLAAGNPNVYIAGCWAPAGDSGFERYYPGGDYVGFVGCSIYSWSRYNQLFYGNDGSFANIFATKNATLARFFKPIIVRECGVEIGDNQQAWVNAAKQSFASFPLLNTVIYFNAIDSVPWVAGGPIPDWEISPFIWRP